MNILKPISCSVPAGRLEYLAYAVLLRVAIKGVDQWQNHIASDSPVMLLTLAVLCGAAFLYVAAVFRRGIDLDIRWLGWAALVIVGGDLVNGLVVGVLMAPEYSILTTDAERWIDALDALTTFASIPLHLVCLFRRGTLARAQKKLDKALAATDPAGAQL